MFTYACGIRRASMDQAAGTMELHTALADVLERMEAANKVMYREGLIHLI